MRDFTRAYRELAREIGGCPIEQGFLLNLADHECEHGRLPFDRSPACGCWPHEARVIDLPVPVENDNQKEADRAA